MLDDGVDVGKVCHISFLYGMTCAHDCIKLILCACLNLRMHNHLRKDPLHEDGGGVSSSKNHFLKETYTSQSHFIHKGKFWISNLLDGVK